MTNPLIQSRSNASPHIWVPGVLLLSLLTACGGGSDDSAVLGEFESASKASSTRTAPGKPPKNGGTTEPVTAPVTSDDTSPQEPVTTLPSDSTNSGSTDMLPVAVAPFDCAAGAITCVEVVSTSTAAQGSVPVTFGQPFRAGHWMHGTHGLIGKVGDQTIALQADEISSHRDGSARFAVLSAQLSNVQAGQTRIINIFAGAKSNPAPVVPADPDWNLELEARLYDANNQVTATLVAQPQAQLKAMIAANAAPRLRGNVATEYTVVAPFRDKVSGTVHPHLTARLHTRLVDGGARVRTDMVLENTRTWTSAPGNLTYDLSVKRNGAAVYSQPRFTHYHHARWHKVVWTGGAEPAAQVRHHMPYFLATRATWNYDLNVKVPETTLAAQYSSLLQKRQEQAALGPMGNALLMPAFSTTGARAEIGPHPRWTALYLLSQDARAREVMLANSDAAASVPIHYRDEATDQPLDVTRHPTVTVQFGTSRPALPATTGTTIWSPDTAHQGSFSYVPYLITGDAFHLDETAFWASWNVASINPSYRGTSEGLVHSNQVRAQAWALRSLGEAAWALPDNHPMKSYFQVRLANNLNWYVNNYVNNANQSPMGIIHNHGDVNRIHPWQNDYVSTVLSLMSENSEPQAATALNWFSKFTVGRFNAEPSGFCTARAPGGGWVYRDASGQFIKSWSQLYAANYAADVGTPCSSLSITEGYPALAIGYSASARAVLGAASNAGVSGAATAYQRWKTMTPLMDEKMPHDPTWAIVPRR